MAQTSERGKKMSGKILWAGLTVFVTGMAFNWNRIVPEVGAVIMVVGLVLLLLDK